MNIKNFIAAGLIVFAVSGIQGQVLITSFGTTAEAVPGSWAYDDGTSTLTGTEGFSDSLKNTEPFIPLNLTGATGLSLTANATTAPFGAFQIVLRDSSGIAKYASADFLWSAFNSPGGAVQVMFSSIDSGFNFSQVVGWSLVGGASLQSIDVQLSSLSAVPEPSAGILLALASMGLVFFARKKKTSWSKLSLS